MHEDNNVNGKKKVPDEGNLGQASKQSTGRP